MLGSNGGKARSDGHRSEVYMHDDFKSLPIGEVVPSESEVGSEYAIVTVLIISKSTQVPVSSHSAIMNQLIS